LAEFKTSSTTTRISTFYSIYDNNLSSSLQIRVLVFDAASRKYSATLAMSAFSSIRANVTIQVPDHKPAYMLSISQILDMQRDYEDLFIV
jgi:hypothetical protein